MRVLQVIESAYRCTIEEQDDPAVWITHAMSGAGARLDVLLRGNAVNYALTGQNAAGLRFGAVEQTQPPRIDHEISKLVDKGANVYVILEDSMERGISPDRHVDGIHSVSREDIPRLFDGYDQVWHW